MKKGGEAMHTIISVTENGDKIAENISKHLENCKVYNRDEVKRLGLKEVTEKAIKESLSLIFISSTGIAVRAIAPFIISKDKDPGVLVIDSLGKVVISLLSGHLGGANALCKKVANIIKAEPIITTATDNFKKEAPDVIAKDNNLIIDDLKKAKDISVKLIEGQKVVFIDDRNLIKLPKGYVRLPSNKDLSEENENCLGLLWVTDKINLDDEFLESKKKFKTCLRLIRKDVVLGIGCRKNFSEEDMRERVLGFLKEHNIDYRAVKTVATVEVKAEEKAIINLASFLRAELLIFTLQDIKKVQHRYEGSDFVEKTIGVRCVSDPCCELAGGDLVVKKAKLKGMTLSIGTEIMK
ncbi:cobalt-precorrin 5A hydrolase [Haloimpatiens sp. FM7315]|uniref:cobalt-precorrin 5A hydrolase n=1 Tax=Haloimpatiens sp. FM7315 TaxID=3298609 RepID=UPI00370B2E49